MNELQETLKQQEIAIEQLLQAMTLNKKTIAIQEERISVLEGTIRILEKQQRRVNPTATNVVKVAPVKPNWIFRIIAYIPLGIVVTLYCMYLAQFL